MSRFIKHLEAIGIHGRFDIKLDFKDGINIIHGSNGTGKTTLLHILLMQLMKILDVLGI